MKCKQLIHLGIYHPSSRFFFMMDETVEDFEFRNIFNDYFSRHPQVGIIQRVRTKVMDKAMYKIYGYNLFAKENGGPIVQINFIWTTNNTINNIKDAFSDRRKFQGKHFAIGGQPGIKGHGIQADRIPVEDPDYSPTNQFRYLPTYICMV